MSALQQIAHLLLLQRLILVVPSSVAIRHHRILGFGQGTWRFIDPAPTFFTNEITEVSRFLSFHNQDYTAGTWMPGFKFSVCCYTLCQLHPK